MACPKRIDFLSFISGALAIPAAFVVTYLRSIHDSSSGLVLGWLETWGFVNEPAHVKPSVSVLQFPSLDKFGVFHEPVVIVAGAPEMSDPGYFSINDENAIVFLIAASVLLGLVAMATALWAEYRRKPTLYLSMGYVCGALAITQIRLLAGLVFFIVGITAVLIMRRHQD